MVEVGGQESREAWRGDGHGLREVNSKPNTRLNKECIPDSRRRADRGMLRIIRIAIAEIS